MNNLNLFYYFSILSDFKEVICGFMIGFVVITLLALLVFCILVGDYYSNLTKHGSSEPERDKNERHIRASKISMNIFKNLAIISFIFCLVFGLSYAAVPTKKDAIFILAGGGSLDNIKNDSTMNPKVKQYVLRHIEGFETQKK